jgi:hypothetical protein
MGYTGQFYSNLLVILKCDTKGALIKLPYKYHFLKHLFDSTSNMHYFHSKLMEEDAQNETIKNNTGEVDPLYEKHQHEIQPYLRLNKVTNIKELLFALKSKFS